jgi:hypothetical protein
MIACCSLAAMYSLIILLISDSQGAHRSGWIACLVGFLAVSLVKMLNTYISINGRALTDLPKMTHWYLVLKANLVILVATLLLHSWNLAERIT